MDPKNGAVLIFTKIKENVRDLAGLFVLREKMKEENKNELKMIQHLNRIMDNLGKYWHSIELLLSHVKQPILVDDRGLKDVLSRLTEKMESIVTSIEHLDLTQTFSEIKYIGNRLNNIEKSISEVISEGVKKRIHLEFTCDGYEMAKKVPECLVMTSKEAYNPETNVMMLLSSLSEKEAKTIIHRLGLFGEKKKTYEEIGKIFKVQRERARQIYSKAIRKLRSPSRRDAVEIITHKELRKEILGE